MRLGRIVRLLELIALLQSGAGRNASALARECGVSKRTIFRDLDVLRLAGLTLQFHAESQVYRIPGEAYLPATNFTPPEALALLVLSQELGDKTGMPFQSAARSAALKLQSSLPHALRDYVREHAPSVRIRLEPTGRLEGQEPIYQQLLSAIAERRCVRLHYQSVAEHGEICTRLSPYRLLFSRRSWYVVGRSSLHRQTRTFHVGRILRLDTLADRFQIPRGFSLERYLRNAWHLIPEPGRDKEVVLHFAPLVAQNVAEVMWHKTQYTTFLPDGSLEFCVTVSGLNEISWWILGYGDQVEVVSPRELRDLVAGRCARLLERYEPGFRDNGAAERGGAAGNGVTKRRSAIARGKPAASTRKTAPSARKATRRGKSQKAPQTKPRRRIK